MFQMRAKFMMKKYVQCSGLRKKNQFSKTSIFENILEHWIFSTRPSCTSFHHETLHASETFNDVCFKTYHIFLGGGISFYCLSRVYMHLEAVGHSRSNHSIKRKLDLYYYYYYEIIQDNNIPSSSSYGPESPKVYEVRF